MVKDGRSKNAFELNYDVIKEGKVGIAKCKTFPYIIHGR